MPPWSFKAHVGSYAMLEVIKTIANDMAALEALAKHETLDVRRVVLAALCHLQLGLDLLDQLTPSKP